MVIGSDSRNGLGRQYGSGLVTDQSDTLMIIHIPASRQWAEVMSIPRDSYVNIPACEMGDGQLSAPTQGKINEAFALGNLDGNHTKLGVACTVKTVEQDTGIYIDHFIVVNFTGFKEMVAALGGVYECNPTPINDPNSHLQLSAGTHLLTPAQALGYVRARYTIGDGSDLERIGRQQAFMSSLVSRVQEQAAGPGGDLPVPRRDDQGADRRQPARRGHRAVQPGPVAARHPEEQDRLLHRAERARPGQHRPTCCGRSRRTARSSPRSATTCPPAARCSARAGRPGRGQRGGEHGRGGHGRGGHGPPGGDLRRQQQAGPKTSGEPAQDPGAHRQPVHLRWLNCCADCAGAGRATVVRVNWASGLRPGRRWAAALAAARCGAVLALPLLAAAAPARAAAPAGRASPGRPPATW